MEEDYQENYHKAREVVAKELIEKYGFVESYRDIYRLTMDSSNYSFHLSFKAPEGKMFHVTEKGDRPKSSHSFLAYIFKITENDVEKAKLLLAEVFESMNGTEEDDMYSKDTLVKSFQIELSFLSERNPHMFT